MSTLRRRSPASLVLARQGVTLSQVAAALGISTSAVSIQLAGRRRRHPALIPVLRSLVGVAATDEILVLLGHTDGRP